MNPSTILRTLLVVLAVLAGTALIGAAQTNSDTNTTDNETGDGGGTDANTTASEDDEADGFRPLGDGVQGSHVEFTHDPSTGTVCGFTYEGSLILTSIAFADFSGEAQIDGASALIRDTGSSAGQDADSNGTESNGTESNGTESNGTESNGTESNETNVETPCPEGGVTPQGPAASGDATGTPAADTALKLHDNARGFIKTELRGAEAVAYSFSENVTLSQEAPTRILIEGDGFSARLWKDADANEQGFDISGQTVTVTSERKANIMFRVAAADAEVEPEVEAAIVDGRVGAEIELEDSDEAFVADIDDVQISNVRVQETRIDLDVTVNVEADENDSGPQPRPEPTPEPGNGTDDNGTADNGSEPTALGTPATVIVADLDITQIQSIGDVVVLLNDEPVATADSAEDAVSIDPDEEPEAHITMTSESSAQVVTSVPTGTNSISLESASATPIVDTKDVTNIDIDNDNQNENSNDQDQSLGGSGGDGQASGNDSEPLQNIPGPSVGLIVLVGLIGAAVLSARRW